jgi:hypothetical protein
MSCGLQVEAGGCAVRWSASADLTSWLMLHFTFESAGYKNEFSPIKITEINLKLFFI